MSTGFHALEVTEVRRETDDAVSLRLAVPASLRDAFRHSPGQHLTLRTELDGEEARRSYSICTAPHEDELRVAIKRIEGGAFSAWANDAVAVGDQLDVMPPHGSFTWTFDPSRAATYAGFAAGSGITPILSIMKAALVIETRSRFVLFYGNRTSSSIMFLDEIAALKNRFLDRLQVLHFLTEEEDDIALFNGRLDAGKLGEIFGRLVDPSDLDAAFICGPGAMIDAIEAALIAAQLPAAAILSERFAVGAISDADRVAVQERAREAAGRQVKLTIDGRRRTLTFDAEKGSILENARAVGLAAPFACKAGVCATCRAKVVAGEVAMHRNFGLSQDEVARGYVLTCQAVPLSDNVELNFDA
ncbi:1,2-phenylacetyl-CoA epoxidase subunit PaaE [Sphingomonas bacterium]|uniref:1,2-phenylacetyl-CoA epoxidase subunit PaaE n=1 Tax=Sphingomonas bacterium TaxID=1895847 RepID=UPI0026167B7B|nr:1,2-phenylacetyl-CoA epoxidase subunit PaaE [Sphingomonas bacterium]MDB5677933.1 phenylacetate-CoA oxygenase/reductase, PaaK subunit [Sphingomonas bacterium]